MDSRKYVYRTTGMVLLGELLLCAAMIGVFALFGKFTLSVIWGALMGAAVAAANFFIMALCADLAADKAENQDVQGGKALIQKSYAGRLLLLFLVLILCAKSGVFNLIALVLPLAFVRPILTIYELFHKKKGGDSK